MDRKDIEQAGQWTARVLQEKDGRIAELERELRTERSRTESASALGEMEMASRCREAESLNVSLREQLASVKEELSRAQQQSFESMRFLEGMQGVEEKQNEAERLQLQVANNLMETEMEELQARNTEMKEEMETMRSKQQAAFDAFRQRVAEQLDQLLQRAALLDQAADQEIEELEHFRDKLHSHETETSLDGQSIQTRIDQLTAQMTERSHNEMARLEAELQKGSEEMTKLAQVVMAEKEQELEELRTANVSLQHAVEKLLQERQRDMETWKTERQQETENLRLELEGEHEKRRINLEQESERRRVERETETRLFEETLLEREKELGLKSAWMESEVQKLAKYALALQSRSAAFSDWQEKALAASKVLQGRMRQLNAKVVTLNRQLAARGAPQIDLSQDLELEAARKFVQEEALQQQEESQVDSHETKSTLHPSSSEIVSI